MTALRHLARALALCAIFVTTASGQSSINGIVVDASGAPVAGATIAVEGQADGAVHSGNDGRFRIAGARPDAQLRISAQGFATAVIRLTAPVSDEPLRIVLAPASVSESITVTASRGLNALETPAAATVLTNAELVNSAAGAVDDALRNTPGFTLFRRSSSRVANPTTQGVTLRGVSGSGASRTLVLADGLPLNDPFGSWVYWNRIPQAAIDRIEVVRGATGDLYGADALGGVIQVLTLSPAHLRVRAITEGGSNDTARGSVFGGYGTRGWNVAVAGEALGTDGVFVLRPEDRGAVDRPADSDYHSAFASVGYERDTWRGTIRASVYGEDRGNGTARQINNTDWHQVAGDVRGPAGGGVWTARVAGGTQNYYQTFTAVAVDRSSERLTTEQRTPSSFATYGGQWTRSFGSAAVLAGAEGKWIDTDGSAINYSLTNVPSAPAPFGGTETVGSTFGRVSLTPRRDLTIVAGARVDAWDVEPIDPQLPKHSATFFSPRASAAWRHGDVSLQGSVYHANRTPTLNELYRGFRVGTVQTNPNPLLEPERLSGFEGGVLLVHGAVSTRATAFWNQLTNAIANVSLTPVLRQRQNADEIHATGVEIEADVRPASTLTINGVAVFTSSHFRDEVTQPQLEGKRVPQVAPYQFGLGVVYAPRLLTITAQTRWIGPQYEDDVNTLKLDSYGVMDLSASRTITHMLTAFVAVENLFDAEYAVGKTPVATVPASVLTTIGWPRTARVGVRVFLP
jgi:outer membrane cobalamin receptor